MTLEFPGKRSGFVHDVASADRVVPIDAETRDSELSESERDATRRMLGAIGTSDELVDESITPPLERSRVQDVAIPPELENQGILTEKESDAVRQALFPSNRAKRIGKAAARNARRAH